MILRIFTKLRLVRVDDVVPIAVSHADVLNRVLLALTVDYGSVVLSRVVVDDSAVIALLIFMPTDVYLLCDTRAALRFHNIAESSAFVSNNRVTVVNVGVDCRPKDHDERLSHNVINKRTFGMRCGDDDVVKHGGTVEYNNCSVG